MWITVTDNFDWSRNIRNRYDVVNFVEQILINTDRREICSKEALDLIRGSGRLKFNLEKPGKVGVILVDSKRFLKTYKYCSYVKGKANVYRLRNPRRLKV